MKSKDWQRLFVMYSCVCYVFIYFFFGRQPTECLCDMTLFLFKIFKEGVVVQWLARRGFDLKVGALLRHKSVLHIVSLHPAV